MPKAKKVFVLNFSGNNISYLQPRDYFKHTSYLDLSNSQLLNITDNAWLQLSNVDQIYLHNNLLTTIPSVANISNFKFTVLSLHNNPLSCSCDQAWLKTYMNSVYDRLHNPLAILCHSPPRLKGRGIFTINDAEFCRDPIVSSVDNNTQIVSTISIISVITAVVFVAVFILIRVFRVKVFSTLGYHLFDRDECEGEEMDYDVFLAFAHEDTVQAKKLLAVLELNSCKVCFHQRDFPPGETIMNNIIESIYKSKRVLCLISLNFLLSQYCMEEFDIALCNSIQLKRRRVIAIMSGQFHFPENDEECLNGTEEQMEERILLSGQQFSDQSASSRERFLSLKNFISRHTYVDCESEDWKEQLLYGMPVKRCYGTYNYCTLITVSNLLDPLHFT